MSPENAPQAPVAPITPEEITRLQRDLFPPEVLETFNRFIGQTILNGEAIVKQDEVIEELVARGIERALIFKKGWLNVEDVYREAGWKVDYDKPGYSETYPAFFRFKAPRK